MALLVPVGNQFTVIIYPQIFHVAPNIIMSKLNTVKPA